LNFSSELGVGEVPLMRPLLSRDVGLLGWGKLSKKLSWMLYYKSGSHYSQLRILKPRLIMWLLVVAQLKLSCGR